MESISFEKWGNIVKIGESQSIARKMSKPVSKFAGMFRRLRQFLQFWQH